MILIWTMKLFFKFSMDGENSKVKNLISQSVVRGRFDLASWEVRESVRRTQLIENIIFNNFILNNDWKKRFCLILSNLFCLDSLKVAWFGQICQIYCFEICQFQVSLKEFVQSCRLVFQFSYFFDEITLIRDSSLIILKKVNRQSVLLI